MRCFSGKPLAQIYFLCHHVMTFWHSFPAHLQVSMAEPNSIGVRQVPEIDASGIIGGITWWSTKRQGTLRKCTVWTYQHVIEEGIWVSSIYNLSREYYLPAASCLQYYIRVFKWLHGELLPTNCCTGYGSCNSWAWDGLSNPSNSLVPVMAHSGMVAWKL